MATVSTLDKRLSKIEQRIGVNEDGSLNGNGFIHAMKEIKEQLDSHENYLNNLSDDMIKIDHRIDKIETLVKETNEERLKLLQEVKEEQKRIINDIKEIKIYLDDSFTATKLKKYMNIIILLAGTITALGTIFGAIYFFSNHFLSK